MVSPLGWPVMVSVHGASGQVNATCRLTVEVMALAWFAGVVTVGTEYTVQLNGAVVAEAFVLSVTVTVMPVVVLSAEAGATPLITPLAGSIVSHVGRPLAE